MNPPRQLHWLNLLLLVTLVLCLLWLGEKYRDSRRPRSSLPQPSGQRVAWSAVDWARIPIAGLGCSLSNNVWNKSAAGVHYEQEIFLDTLDGKQAAGWRWNAPPPSDSSLASAVAAYPELICGQKPWEEPTDMHPGLPFHPDDRLLLVDYKVRLRATGSYNLAFSMWVVSALPATPSSIRYEVMIWIAQSNLFPAGLPRGTVTVQGVPFDIYVNEHHHDFTNVNRNAWTYIAFVARAPMLQGTLDLSAFIEELRRRNLLGNDLFITDLELGTEVSSGSGIAEIQDFTLSFREPHHRLR